MSGNRQLSHELGKSQRPSHSQKREQATKKKLPANISVTNLWENFYEKLIFDVMYEHINDNKLLTPNQSGFRQDDSTVNQLLYITHQIYIAFEEYPARETRVVFLYISKAFDKVWHDGLVFKLKTYGIMGPLLFLIESYRY